jgi:16S rRNA (cytosine967-C5)-methyltransferase
VSGSEEKTRGVRQLASEILLKVDTRNAFSDILLDHGYTSPSLSERDRALLTELVYGTLRWRGKIDAQLTRQLRRPLNDSDPFLRNLLRVTVYQVLFLDKIPDYAAVNEAVRLAKAHGGKKAAGFMNGVLRNVLREREQPSSRQPQPDPIAALAIDYSHPEWLARRWIEEFGREDAIALMAANNEKPSLVARVNVRKANREQVLELFRTHGIKAEATRWSPQGLCIDGRMAVNRMPGFDQGLFQIQGEASQLVGYLVSPKAGEHILDACAAPGGKATHLAELMGDAGQVLAADKSPRGVRKIEESVKRLGLQSIRMACADMTQPLTAPAPDLFDRILVDAPCSGLGTLRGHPEIKWRRTETDVARLSRLQSALLDRITDYLKPGGILVYSTCTLTGTENNEVVQYFLKRHPQFELQDAADYLPDQAKPLVQDRYFRALPHRHNTDGFFAARMRKVG